MELWAEDEIRTRDPNLGKVVLYQLSYFRIFKRTIIFGLQKYWIDANLKSIFLIVFWRVLRAFRNFHFWFPFVMHAVQSVTSAQNKG